ncbi:ImmA/IrrE family metallo-endopeptidase [bacterium]|nr:ImmA/IrrE family metallo-endopeptidase [bacterium]
MPFDTKMFSKKLKRYCKQFDVSFDEISRDTGIGVERLQALAKAESEPTGDEILILADFFKCDFKFFISNEKLAPFEQTESLFRIHGETLTKDDKWAIQEFLFLCECQEFLLSNNPEIKRRTFTFQKSGKIFKRHGQEASSTLRRYIEYPFNQVPIDLYSDFRKIGIHIFRRKLGQSALSGLFIKHPIAGKCVLVNYDEDVFRQRFTVAHEVAHAILDDDKDFVVSFVRTKWDKNDLSEIRANNFASHYLLPPEFLRTIPDSNTWDDEKFVDWAVKLRVNSEPLAYALKDAGLIDDQQVSNYTKIKISSDKKEDPELSQNLSPKVRERKEEFLKRGLSDFYVRLCFDSYYNGIITAGRLVEILLVHETEIHEIAELYGRRLIYVD